MPAKSAPNYRRLRAQALKHLGNRCKRCGISDSRVLQIDHVFGGGTAQRRLVSRWMFLKIVLADAAGSYQLLCANCNVKKKVENNEL